jgi:hypothetical protein
MRRFSLWVGDVLCFDIPSGFRVARRAPRRRGPVRWLWVFALLAACLLLIEPLAAQGLRLPWSSRVTSDAPGGDGWVVDSGPVDLPDVSDVTVEYTLPTGCSDIAYNATPTGGCKVLLVNSGQNLQTALDGARRGDRVALDCGATFTGPFTYPSKSGSGWVYVTPQDDCLDDLPAYMNRVIPDELVGACDSSAGVYCVSLGANGVPGGGDDVAATPNFDVSAMPTIQGGSSTPHYAISMARGADSYVTMGITVRPSESEYTSSLIRLYPEPFTGDPDPETNDFIFDRLYVPGRATLHSGRAFTVVTPRVAITNSYINRWLLLDGDSQGILIENYSDGVVVINNYISATGENLYTDSHSTPEVIPRDVYFRWNYLRKERDWIAQITGVEGGNNNYKNLFEMKAGHLVLGEANIFADSVASNGAIAAAQESSVNVKIGDEDADKLTSRVTLRKNLWLRVGNGPKMCQTGCNSPGLVGYAFALYNNILEVNGTLYGRDPSTDGHGIYHILGGGAGFFVDNNTMITDGPGVGRAEQGEPSGTRSGTFRNNVLQVGDNAFTTSDANATWPTSYSYTCNVLVGGSSGNHPASQAGFPANWAAVGFVNFNSGTGGDYELDAGSTFKGDCTDNLGVGTTDPGANVPDVMNAVACVVTGQCAAWSPSPSPTPRPTLARVLRLLRP